MSFEVIEADLQNPAHCAGLVDVLDSYASDPWGGGVPLDSEVRDRLAESLRAHPTSLVLLAVENGRAIGTAVCFFGFSTFRARPLLNVHDLAVVPEWRGQGVGRSLLTAAEQRAREGGCCRLTLEVLEPNGPARILYERFGFSDPAGDASGPTLFLAKDLTDS